MRENPQPLRSRAPISRLTLVFLALLLAVPSGAGAAGVFGPSPEQASIFAITGPPTLAVVPDQHSPAGSPVHLVVAGTNLEEASATKLPAGLSQPVVKSETELEITGTPTTEGEETEVTLEARNKEGSPATRKFKWKVGEPLPTITKPGPQHSVAGVAITPLTIEGTRMATLEAFELPAGLELIEKTPTSAKIVGTPTTPGTKTVTLAAQNAEKEPVFTVQFEWIVREPEAQPTITKPSDQTSFAGTAIVPVRVKGTHLAFLAAPELPAGLTLTKKSEEEWEVKGTPTTVKGPTTVTLEAQNAEKGPIVPTAFKWTVGGPPPELEPVSDQTTTVGAPVSLLVTGRHLGFLSATSLPEGLTLEPVSETEWRIVGTPTTAKAATLVTLEAKNSEKLGGAVRVFQWTIAAAVPIGPKPSGTLGVTPAIVFSASRAECGGVSWPVTAVATQWLLDGAPIAGATAATYVPPRADDGHRLSCRQTATSAEAATSTVTSGEHVVYEQPAQPAWPIVGAGQRCRTAVCMIDGGTTAVPSAQSYAQAGQWLAARQVRCVSAPWTSQAGDSAVAAVHRLAAAHSVAVSLQRVTAAGVVTVLIAQSGELPESAAPGPFRGSLGVAAGPQPFAAGELWTRMQSSAAGTPNWFAAGQGALFYLAAGSEAVVRSFQLVYNLTPADLGARLRCVASGEDGPVGTPTHAVFSSPEYSVSASRSCGPRKLGGSNTTQPAPVEPGRAPCLSAPSGPGALEGNQASIAVAKGRAVIALTCALRGSCRGTLSMSAGSVLAGRGTVGLARGRTAILHVRLTARGRRLLARATSGVAVSLQLKTHAAARTLGTARLLSVG